MLSNSSRSFPICDLSNGSDWSEISSSVNNLVSSKYCISAGFLFADIVRHDQLSAIDISIKFLLMCPVSTKYLKQIGA